MPVYVAGLGFGVENAPILFHEPFLGVGLAAATRQALAEAGESLHEISFRLSDVTGESYGFREQALLLARVMRGKRERFPLWHIAESIGDTGAAVGICNVVRAYHAFLEAMHRVIAPSPLLAVCPVLCSRSSPSAQK